MWDKGRSFWGSLVLILLRLLIFIGISSQAWASAPIAEKLKPLLSRFQYLNSSVDSWAVTPRIPVQVTTALNGALIADDLEIHPFNLDRKKKYGFSSSLGGIVVYPQGQIEFQTPLSLFLNSFDSSTRRAIQKMREDTTEDWFKKDYVVFLPDAPISRAAYNPLMVMTHELAHVSFYRRLAKLDVKINKSLFTYLTERYAHEVEFLLLKSLQNDRKHFLITPRKWTDMAHLTEGFVARRRIARYVRDVYQLQEPGLARFDSYAVDEILLLLNEN